MSAEKKNKFRSIAVKLCAIGLTIIVAGLAYLCLTPKRYRAAAKVELLKSGAQTHSGAPSFNLDKLPGECQTARSDEILDRVITNLNLKSTWAKQGGQPSPLTIDKVRDQLRLMLDIQPAPNTAVIEIAANGSDPIELAAIVNEIAKLYSNFRQSGREEASQQGIASLRAKWEAKTQEVQKQETIVRDMWNDFNRDRSSNSVEIYDAKAWEALKAQRSAVQRDYTDKSNALAGLKQLERNDLIKALATNDTGTNLLLVGTSQKLAKAQADLADAQKTRGPDASETRGAAAVVAALSQQVDSQVASALSAREIELSSLNVALQQLRDMAERARHATNNLQRLQGEDAAYTKAKSHLDDLVSERNRLEREIEGTGLAAAVMPDAMTARIVELADPPVKPVSPDGKTAVAAFGVGGVIAGAGLLLLILLQLKPRGPEKSPPDPTFPAIICSQIRHKSAIQWLIVFSRITKAF